MVSVDELMRMLIKGRLECYVKKSSTYNPYTKSVLYDWGFKLQIGDLLFTDSYRGFNPYSGVEYIYENNNNIPIWTCDYVGYVNSCVSGEEVYRLLKEARKNYLKNCNLYKCLM
ncbi:MAG TPA: hypothetical protein DD738_00165 [Ruminiclostridium sp.]|nr:hypothetical protein [Ruminiclostridium sp.]